MSWYQYHGEWIPERPLEPPDCWQESLGSEPVCRCSKCSRRIWPGQYAFDGLCSDCFKTALFIDFTLQEIAEHLGYDVTLC